MLDTVSSAKAIRDRLRNPPNGRFSDEIEVRTPASHRAALAADRQSLTQDNRRLTQDNEKLRVDLRAAEERLASANITIEKQAETFGLLKSLPDGDVQMPAELAIGLKHQTLKGIIWAVSEHMGISIQGLMSRGRTAKLVHARQVSFYIAKKLTTLSLSQIGRRFGRDHTTIIHGIAQIEAKLSTDEKLRVDIETIKTRLDA